MTYHNLSKTPLLQIKFNNSSTKEIEQIINLLKTKNLHEQDEISTKILKFSAPFISSPLTNPHHQEFFLLIENIPLQNSHNMVNYRPICPLTSFSKVLEKIIYERILNYINIDNTLTKNLDFEQNHQLKRLPSNQLMIH